MPFLIGRRQIGDLTPQYILSASVSDVDEGNSFDITLTTNNVPASTSVPYTITGVSSADINGASLTGNFTAGSGSPATDTITFNVTADSLTEGPETFTITLDGPFSTATSTISTLSVSVDINDTSILTAYPYTKTFTAPETNYDFVNDVLLDGWNGTDDIDATITVNPGVSVYSTVQGASGYGMRIAPNPSSNPGTTIPGSSTIDLNVNGFIVGRGGAGGAGGRGQMNSGTHASLPGSPGSPGSPALILGADTTLTMSPTGNIRAGGGGGAGGGGASFEINTPKVDPRYAAGGAGGGGGGHGSPIQGQPVGGGAGGPAALPGTPGPLSNTDSGTAGSPGTATGGSAGSRGIVQPGPAINVRGGTGGNGGNAGNGGGNGGTGIATGSGPSQTRPGGTGGSTGVAIDGTGFTTPGSSLIPGNISGPTTV